MKNAELAYRVLDHIDAHPEEHDQGAWILRRECRTTACFAGRVSLLSGDEPQLDPNGGEWVDSVRSAAIGRVRHIHNRAAALLGITESQADRLFDATNTREDLGGMVTEIFGPRPERTP